MYKEDGSVEIKDLLKQTRKNREHFKTIRANIDFCEGDPKVILVTSSVPNEGKTTISQHIASELAKTDNSVLLMDADLRMSVWKDMLGIPKDNCTGLSDILSGKVTQIKELIHKTDQDNMFMLFAGNIPPNPAELLGRKIFKQLIDVMRQRFDYIIIDAPPITSVIDAAVIAPCCDGVLYVIASDMVSTRVIRRGIEQINRSGGKIIGTVLNKVRYTNRSLYGTYGTNKYDYYYYGQYYK